MPDDLPRARRAARPEAPPEDMEETVVHVRPSEARRGVPVGRIVAATAAACVLLAVAGVGYFVYQDRQDRAARAAYAEYEFTAGKTIEARQAFSKVLQRRPLPDDPSISEWRETESKAAAVAADLHEQSLGLEMRWSRHWRRLGLRTPLPLR